MPRSEMVMGDGRSQSFAARLKSDWQTGDRSRLAQLLIVVLVVVATAMFAASIMTGACRCLRSVTSCVGFWAWRAQNRP